jgi:hypothetical protein
MNLAFDDRALGDLEGIHHWIARAHGVQCTLSSSFWPY